MCVVFADLLQIGTISSADDTAKSYKIIFLMELAQIPLILCSLRHNDLDSMSSPPWHRSAFLWVEREGDAFGSKAGANYGPIA